LVHNQLCTMQEIHGLDLDEVEPSAAMAEEDSAPAAEESTPVPKQRPRRQPWRLRCQRPTLSKVSILRKRRLPPGVVVATEGD
jgi:hypothetical protein